MFLKLLEGIRLFLLSPISAVNLKKFGEWAVVTGATDGIGKAYATELAKRKLNIVLISRNLEKLKKTAEELETYGILTDIIQVDFSKGSENFSHIKENLKDKDIGILVNNVGTLLNHPCLFLQVENSEFVELINMNIMSVIMMDQIVLPSMLDKRSGCIVNTSSLSGLRPLPLKSTYSASKAFVINLCSALNYEFGDKGIVMQSLVPGYVSTKLVKFSDYLQKDSILAPNAERYAASAINTLTRSSISTGYWAHGLQVELINIIPSFVWNYSSIFVQRSLDSRINKQKLKNS